MQPGTDGIDIVRGNLQISAAPFIGWAFIITPGDYAQDFLQGSMKSCIGKIWIAAAT
jgi:hypothetical protein